MVVKLPLAVSQAGQGRTASLRGEKIGVTMTFCSSRAMISFLVPLRGRKRRRFEDVAQRPGTVIDVGWLAGKGR